MQKNKKRPTIAFAGVLIFGFALYYAMLAVQPKLGTVLFDYTTWLDNMRTNWFWRVLWLLGDATEPLYHKTVLGGLFVLIGSVIAYILDKKRSRFRGIPTAYGQGKLWPWIFAASFVSMGIIAIIFGGLRIEGDAWSATFVPYVSVAGAVIMLYGGRISTLLTGSILGAVFTSTLTIFLRNEVIFPNNLPPMLATTISMSLGGIITFEICQYLPWMKRKPLPAAEYSPAKVSGEIPVSEYILKYPNRFFIRRMFADYTEPIYVGNEIAGALLMAGSLLSWYFNPMHPVYGCGVFPGILLSQILTGSIAIYLYWDQWVEKGYFSTFVPVMGASPAMVFFFGSSLPVIVISSILGGFACPAVANAINERIPSHWAGLIGATTSMAFCSFMIFCFMKYLVMVFPWMVA